MLMASDRLLHSFATPPTQVKGREWIVNKKMLRRLKQREDKRGNEKRKVKNENREESKREEKIRYKMRKDKKRGGREDKKMINDDRIT